MRTKHSGRRTPRRSPRRLEGRKPPPGSPAAVLTAMASGPTISAEAVADLLAAIAAGARPARYESPFEPPPVAR